MEIGIGSSNNLDSLAAITSAIDQAGVKLVNKPLAAIVFVTIHYKKNNGFNKIIDKIFEQYPEIKLVGGTIAGFMSKDGVFTRGVAVLLVGGEDVDVSIGIGRNTKLNPTSAGASCANKINQDLSKSKFNHKFFITLVSSATVPNLPIINKKRVIEGFPMINLAVDIFGGISKFIQFGAGKDESVLNSMNSALSEYSGIGGASSDDLRLEENYQFYMKEIISNGVIALGVSTNEDVHVKSAFGLKPSGKKMTITSTSKDRYTVKKIDGLPAVNGYLKAMGWDRNLLDERLYRKVFYFPIIEENTPVENMEPRMFGLVYGNNFIFPMKSKEGNLEIYQSSGADIMNSCREVSQNSKNKTAFLVSCATRLETLGRKTFKIKEEIYDKNFDDYLLIYTAGEYAKKKDLGTKCLYQSENAMIFGKD